jgi:signal peptidase I
MTSHDVRARAKGWWRRELRPLLILALIVFSVRSSLADWNDVPTGSMKPTIFEGDRVWVNKVAYDLKIPFTTWQVLKWGGPQRGEIVVFYSPYDGKRLVKRVIGLPGDKIELRHDNLILNGKAVDYAKLDSRLLVDLAASDRNTHLFATEMLPGKAHVVAAWPAVQARRDFGPITVPRDQYFMMGDNRDDSFDSRYYGTVERNRILGRASMSVLSFDHGHYWRPRWDRFFKEI